LKRKKERAKFNLANFGKSLFSRFFGFEEGIDITDEVAVLKEEISLLKTSFLSQTFSTLF
jgi:hypothetical protein